MIAELHAVFPRPFVDKFLQQVQSERIELFHLDVLDSAAGIVWSPLFHLYDAKLWNLLKTFFTAWYMTWDVSRTCYHAYTSSGFATPMNHEFPFGEMDSKVAKVQEFVGKAREGLHLLTCHLKEEYSEFDLDESDRKATESYLRFCEQFENNFQAEKRRWSALSQTRKQKKPS